MALVGRSGSGKSTLASLLPRFYDVERGHITLDGTDIQSYELSNLRRHISFVSQQVTLFNDSLRNNIAYGDMAVRRSDTTGAASPTPTNLESLPDG